MEPVGRRAVLASGLAAGGLVFLPRKGGADSEHGASADCPPGSGVVALWTQFVCGGGATLRVAQLRAGSAEADEMASRTLSPELARSLAQVHAQGRAFLVETVAKSWEANPGGCGLDAKTIWHRPSGRSVRYLVWTDFS